MSNTNQKTGGNDSKLLGVGSYGCAYNPPINCIDGDEHPNAITKLMFSHDANNEMKEYNVIKEVDPEGQFTVSALRVCKPDLSSADLQKYVKETCEPTKDKKPEELALIVLENGGIDLEKMVKNINRISDTDVRRHEIKKMLVRMMDIITGVDRFKEAEVIHRDIKLQNIVFNENTGATKFIDFGLAISFADVVTESEQNQYWLGKDIFWSVPPYSLFFSRKRWNNLTRKYPHEFAETVKPKLKKLFEDYFGSYLERYHYHEKIVNHMLNSTEQTVTRLYGSYTFKEFLRDSCNLLDMYNVGICFMQLLGYISHPSDISHNKLLLNDLLEYIEKTINCNIFEHISTKDAVELYHDLLTRHNLYEETGLEYKDGRIVDNNILKITDDDVDAPDEIASISTPTEFQYKSPSEHKEAFKKSIETPTENKGSRTTKKKTKTTPLTTIDLETPTENKGSRATRKKTKLKSANNKTYKSRSKTLPSIKSQ